jgi:hypothetical protein
MRPIRCRILDPSQTWARLRRSPGGNEGLCSLDQIGLIQRQYVAAHKGDLHLIVPQRFFVQDRHAQGDRHLYASRTHFIPEKLLGLFERTIWPVVSADTAARTASQGPKPDIRAPHAGDVAIEPTAARTDAPSSSRH